MDVESLVEETVRVAGRELRLLKPPSAEELIDEDAFSRDEFLPYWAELWPTAVALAEAVAARGVRGLRVVELGCGLAVPSLAAARNGLRVDARVVSWADPPDLGAFDLVLASDVLYEARNAEQLLALLPRLAPEVLLADPDRPYAAGFLERAAAGWVVEALPDRVFRLVRRA